MSGRLPQPGCCCLPLCERWITGVKAFGGTVPFDYVDGDEVVKVYLKRTDTFAWNTYGDCLDIPGAPFSATEVTEISRKYADLKYSSLTTGIHGLVHEEQRTDEEIALTVYDQFADGVSSPPSPSDLIWAIGPGGLYYQGGSQFHQLAGRCGDAGGSVVEIVDEATRIERWYDVTETFVTSTKTSVLSVPYTKAEWFADTVELMDLIGLSEDFVLTFDDPGAPEFSRFGCTEREDGYPITNEVQMTFLRAYAERVFRGVHGIELLETGASYDVPAQKIISGGVTCKKAFFPNADPYTVLCVTKRLQTWSGGAYGFGDYLCEQICPTSPIIFRCTDQGELYRNHAADDDPDCCDC